MAEAGTTTGAVSLAALSEAMAGAVARVAPSVVSVDDGTRLTATGVIWDNTGLVVATSHGVERDDDLAVVTQEGVRHPATLLGRDADTDIAVLKVAATDLTAIGREASPVPQVGALALAVGRPGDAGLAATLGVVSARRDTETAGHPEYILYTDAVLYPGFSGGAFIDAGTGAFLGLLNRLYGRGLGVALGTPLVERVVATLQQYGRIPRGYLGIRTQLVALPVGLRTSLNLAQEHGLLIANVEPDSPADHSGLILGDTLLQIDGAPVEDVGDLRSHLHAGKAVQLSILRGGAAIEVAATVGADRS